ncbi:MAG: hypothetical protein V3R86_00355 [Candidatus Hydrothermarchaeaceae archaeon]
MKLLALFLMLAVLPSAFAQEGLFVSRHSVTYTLGESDFFVEERIIFENKGSLNSNLFRDNIYFSRGNAQDVAVDVKGKNLGYSVEYSPFTTINIKLLLWKGERREVTLRYRRSDMVFRGGAVNAISGLALGKYPWTINRAKITFIAPEGFLFGNVTPYVTKTVIGGRKTLSYDLSPINLANFTAIRDGFPVRIEYAKYDEMALSEIKNAKEFIEDLNSDIKSANKSIENARGHGSELEQVLALFSVAVRTHENSKIALGLAEIKSNAYSEDYDPYLAYYYAIKSKNLSRDASRRAEESKDLANFETQRTLEEKISGIGSKLSGLPDDRGRAPSLVPEKPKEALGPLKGPLAAIILILLALAISGVYIYRGKDSGAPEPKRGTVKDFKGISDLKYKNFEGFDKKINTVKHSTALATEIRSLMKRKEKLEFDIETLRKMKISGQMPGKKFETEKEKIDRKIDETAANIARLQIKLKDIKKAKR